MQSRSFSLFVESMKSPSTKQVYTYAIKEFMRFSKIKEYDDITKFSTEKIQKLLENWVISLKGRNLKASTITTKLNGVELFLDMNKVIFHKRILHRLLPSDDYVPTRKLNEILKSLAGRCWDLVMF